MTSFTPVYGLEYPDALDAPCDFPADWCEFTGDLDAVLARFELGASRVLPAIPIAKVQVTEQITVLENQAIPFDTVSIDTSGWTNFDVSNSIISIPRTARYTVSATAIVASQGVANTSWTMQINGAPFQFVDTLDRNTNDVAISVNGTGTISAGTDVAMFMLAGTAITSFTLRLASLSVYWHADTERPS